ncbi:MAG: VOC family protein, partial [Pseudomonadota bacterium]
FTLTPRARHPDHMGTSNRLVQFSDHTFIELLEVDRPETCLPHRPGHFSFGHHAQGFLDQGEGVAMTVLAGSDAPGDAAEFAAAGFGEFAPFDFGRKATLPDGTDVEVAFSLAFAMPKGLGRSGFFTCHNKYPENFWKPAFQVHKNPAAGMAAIFLASDDPDAHRADIEILTRADATPKPGGFQIACGPDQALVVATPAAIADISGLPEPAAPGFAGLALYGEGTRAIPAADAHGMFILTTPG